MDCAYSSDTIAEAANGNRQQRSTSSLQLSEDIRTRSIEKTLLPLLSQINTLVSSRGGSQSPANLQQQHQQHPVGLKPGSVAQQHAARVGLLVAAAADKFVTVGESLSEEYPDAALEMREACNEVQSSALELRRLTDLNATVKPGGSSSRGTSPSRTVMANATMTQRQARELSPGVSSSSSIPDSLAVVTTSRQLLSSITKVLLLADKLCVKQILAARDRVSYWLQELENVSSRPTAALAEFVATFSELGRALVELAHLSGDRQADLRLDKDREALAVCRATLERGTQLLLAAAKTCLRHPESVAAARVRDSILRMMRQALNSIGQTLNDTVSVGNSSAGNGSFIGQQGPGAIVPQSESDSSGATGDSGFPLSSATRSDRSETSPPLRELVSNVRALVDGEAFSLGGGSAAIRRLDGEVNRLADALQDFTDCAYTPHASRERLLGLLDRLRAETSQVAEQAQSPEANDPALTDGDTIRLAVNRLSDTVSFLQTECQRTADQLAVAALENRTASLTGKMSRGTISHSSPDVGAAADSMVDDYTTLINQLEYVALSGDQTAFRCSSASFEQRADLAIEAARLFRHVAPNDCLLMDAEHVLTWLRLIAAALLASAQVLFEQFPNPVSRVSRESFRSFALAWNDCTSRLLANLAVRCCATMGNNGQAQQRLQQSPGCIDSGGIFASPTSFSNYMNLAQNSPLGTSNSNVNAQALSSTFCSAESLSTVATPPNGHPASSHRQSSLPRQAQRGMFGMFSPPQQQQQSQQQSPLLQGQYSSAPVANPNPVNSYTLGAQTTASGGGGYVKRSGSQPSLFDHLRQLRRHADNLSAMDGAVASFNTGNGPLNSTADLMLQAQFVAEQARTICRLSTTTACQLPSTHGLRDTVLGAVEKALAATGRLEAVLAMPPPIVPTAPYQSQAAAGITVKNERVIASCHSAVVAAGNVVNTLLQSSLVVPDANIVVANGDSNGNGGGGGVIRGVATAQSQSNLSMQQHHALGNGRIFMGSAHFDGTSEINNDHLRRGGRRPWYSRSAANLAPNGAHPLSLGDHQFVSYEHQFVQQQQQHQQYQQQQQQRHQQQLQQQQQ